MHSVGDALTYSDAGADCHLAAMTLRAQVLAWCSHEQFTGSYAGHCM